MAVSSMWFQTWGPPSHVQNIYATQHHPKPLFTTRHQEPPRFQEPIHRDPPRFQEPTYQGPQYQAPRYQENTQYYHGQQPRKNMAGYLPYLLALGMVAPSLQHAWPQSQRSQYQNRRPLRTRTNYIPQEETGPFTTVYSWNQLDFEFPSELERVEAISSQRFIKENNLPLGVEAWKDRIFVSMPKWKNGVPATLAWLPKKPSEQSPRLMPYPNWDWHTTDSCAGMTSVFRMQTDTCGRLWVLDSGLIEVTIKPKQVCPPQILVFDLNTDKLIRRHVLQEKHIKEDSLYSNIVVDVRDGDCENVHAYVTDVWRFGLVVYSFENDRSWRVTNHLFYPDPLASAYKLHDLEFSWTDGIFGLTLSPVDRKTNDRTLFFHPMSSFREFYVKTSVICNETGHDAPEEYKVLGQSRGKSGHVSATAMDRKGVLFFNFVTRDSIGCWDSRKAYTRRNIGIVAHNSSTMVFPNDLRIDKEERQGVWVVTNRLPFYLYRTLNPHETNFRIMHAYADEAVKGTICDPEVYDEESFTPYNSDEDCY